MNANTICAAVIGFLVGGFAAFVLTMIPAVLFFLREKGRYEDALAFLEAERDAAKNEARGYLQILAPITKRAADASPNGTNAVPVNHSPVTARPMRGNASWKKFFNDIRAASNKKQQHVDALAAALENQQRQQSVSEEKKAYVS